MMTPSQTPSRLLIWLRRYLPAELLSSACALIVALSVHALTANAAIAALSSTVAGSISFYAVILGDEMRRRGLRALPSIVRALALEFGPSELLDTLLLRPAFLCAGLSLASDPAFGVIVGKVAADLCFYAPAILSYELQQGGRVRDADHGASHPRPSVDARRRGQLSDLPPVAR